VAQVRKTVLSVVSMMIAAAVLAGPAGTARAASDDAVDPSFYNPGGMTCAPYYPHPDPLGSYGGAPGLTAYVFQANAGCNTAIWSDYGFTRNRLCTIDVYVSASANANITYHIELDKPGGGIYSDAFTLDQDPYYGWHRIEYGLQGQSIRTVWMDDSTWGDSKQSIGAAGMDFTCQ